MDERAELTHVALPTGRTHPQTYEHFAVSKYALRLGDRAVHASSSSNPNPHPHRSNPTAHRSNPNSYPNPYPTPDQVHASSGLRFLPLLQVRDRGRGSGRGTGRGRGRGEGLG